MPPSEKDDEILIRMRIFRCDYLKGEKSLSAKNASVVVELYPSNLELLKPAILTLNHPLGPRNGKSCTPKVYSSYHEEGNY